MNIKRILPIALCFLLLFSFGLGSYAEVQGNKDEILRYARNDNERAQNGNEGAYNDNVEIQNDNKGIRNDNKGVQDDILTAEEATSEKAIVEGITAEQATVGEITAEQAGEYLKKIELYRGYEDGSLGLDRNITRAEFATLAVRIEGMEDVQEKHRGETIFKDMAASHWASGYVNIAVSKDLIKGFEDKTFRPEEEITYVQALAVVIRILGYEKDVVGEWPDNYIEKGMDLGLDRHIGLSADDVINRGEIAVLIYNALEITIQ